MTDKERIDWLENNASGSFDDWVLQISEFLGLDAVDRLDLRKVIDAANEAGL